MQSDLTRIMGITNNYGENTYLHAQWHCSSTVLENREGLEEYCSSGVIVSLLENLSAQNNGFLVYGDSHWFLERNLPYYFGESFKSVITTSRREVDTSLDDVVEPDVVVFSCGERAIENTLTIVPKIPHIVNELPNLPMKLGDDIIPGGSNWNHGIRVDTCNNVWLDDSSMILIPSSDDMINLVGWSIDNSSGMPLSALYLKIDNLLFQCDYGLTREDVATYFSNELLKNTGFSVTIPRDYFNDNGSESLEFIGMSSNQEFLFTLAKYQITASQN